MSRALGCAQGTVWQWTQNGVIPQRRWPAIIEAGRHLNPPVELEPQDFIDAPRRKSRCAA